MSIVLVGSTSGSVTLQEPAVAGTTVLTLPAVSGNVLTDTSPKAGNVIQVVNATFSTSSSTTSTSYGDTGLSASITPTSSSSKILIFANIPDVFNNTNASTIAYFNIVRGSTQIIEFVKHGNFINLSNNLITFGGSTSYLDNPATTSSTTYKVQTKTSTGTLNWCYNNSTATITLMEIAA
jgi:hypothetical protein